MEPFLLKIQNSLFELNKTLIVVILRKEGLMKKHAFRYVR